MKKFSKIIVAVLAIAMLSVSFAGCGLVEDTENVEKVKIQKETMLTIGDDITVSGAYYGWYFSNAYEAAYSKASQEAQANQESVAGSDAVSASDAAAASDAVANSAAVSSAEAPQAEAPAEIKVDVKEVKKQAIDDIVAVKLACNKAKEAGIELTDKDYAAISSQIESFRSGISSQLLAANVSYSDYLLAINTNVETVEKVYEDMYMASLYYASLVSDDYVTTKHILVMYGDESRTKDEAKKMADDIKAQLDGGADFEKLMNEKSEDSKDASGNFASYTFTKEGPYVQPFKDTAFALKEGEISAPVNVEDSYNGYHIIKRYPVSLSDVAQSLENSEKIDEARKELSASAKVKEGKKISYYSKSFEN